MSLWSILFFHVFVLSNTQFPLNTPQPSEGPWSYSNVTGYSGLILMNPLTGSSIFYWLFESLNGNITTDTTPLLIWLAGGPGCSGSFVMLWEYISSLHLSSENILYPTPNNLTWCTNFHILSIDFPYGAGFSYANSNNDVKNNTQDATAYLLKFLNKLGEKYPSWFNRKVYIFGESYGGHWVPALGWQILQQNNQGVGMKIDLRGIGMGDPLVDPKSQSLSYSAYGMSFSLIDDYQAKIVNLYQNKISLDYLQGNYMKAFYDKGYLLDAITSFAGDVNVYNIRLYEDYNFDELITFMNEPRTKSLIHAPSQITWIDCNDAVFESFSLDMANTTLAFVEYVLSQNVSVLVYQGQYDLIIPAPGTENMVYSLNWAGTQGFSDAPQNVWTVNGNIAGYVQNYDLLTYVLVMKSGHLSDHDQPINIKDMLLRFVDGNWL